MINVTAIAQRIASSSTGTRREKITRILGSIPAPSSRLEELVVYGLVLDLVLGRVEPGPEHLLKRLAPVIALTPADCRRTMAARLARRIGERHAEPLDVPGLARELGVDESTMRRHFKARFGVPPSEYHRRARVSAALKMLAAGDRKISAIGRSVGYADETNFYDAVREFTGRKPGQLRALPAARLRRMACALLAAREVSDKPGALPGGRRQRRGRTSGAAARSDTLPGIRQTVGLH